MDDKNITMDDIRDLIVEAIIPEIDSWPEGYIIDEEQSVRWNREQVADHNKEVENAKKKYYQDRRKGHKNFYVDLKQAIQNDYNFTESQAAIIIEHLNNDGMYEDLDRAEGLCEIVYDILNNG